MPAPQTACNDDSVRTSFDVSNLKASIELTAQIEASLQEMYVNCESQQNLGQCKKLTDTITDWHFAGLDLRMRELY